MSISTFPNGWKKIRLSEIADLKNGGIPSKSNDKFRNGGHIPFVTAADLTELYVNIGKLFLTEKGLHSGKKGG